MQELIWRVAYEVSRWITTRLRKALELAWVVEVWAYERWGHEQVKRWEKEGEG